jgi:hypothetical protein
MRDDVFNSVGIAVDREIEAPVAVYARLPDVLRLVVLLRVQRRVLEVNAQKSQLFCERAPHRGSRISERVDGAVGQNDIHRPEVALLRLAFLALISWAKNVMVLSALANGP